MSSFFAFFGIVRYCACCSACSGVGKKFNVVGRNGRFELTSESKSRLVLNCPCFLCTSPLPTCFPSHAGPPFLTQMTPTGTSHHQPPVISRHQPPPAACLTSSMVRSSGSSTYGPCFCQNTDRGRLASQLLRSQLHLPHLSYRDLCSWRNDGSTTRYARG